MQGKYLCGSAVHNTLIISKNLPAAQLRPTPLTHVLKFPVADFRLQMKGLEMNINDVNVYKVEIVETLRREVAVAAARSSASSPSSRTVRNDEKAWQQLAWGASCSHRVPVESAILR